MGAWIWLTKFQPNRTKVKYLEESGHKDTERQTDTVSSRYVKIIFIIVALPLHSDSRVYDAASSFSVDSLAVTMATDNTDFIPSCHSVTRTSNYFSWLDMIIYQGIYMTNGPQSIGLNWQSVRQTELMSCFPFFAALNIHMQVTNRFSKTQDLRR